MYGSSSGTPLTVIWPNALQQATLSPGRPMTRLTRWSSLSCVPSPTWVRAHWMPCDDRVAARVARRLSARRRKPSARVFEHDDVAAFDRRELRHELVHDDPVVDLKGVLHRRRRDVERANQEGLDQERDQQRREEDDAGCRGGSASRRPCAVPSRRPKSSRGPDAVVASRLRRHVLCRRPPFAPCVLCHLSC